MAGCRSGVWSLLLATAVSAVAGWSPDEAEVHTVWEGVVQSLRGQAPDDLQLLDYQVLHFAFVTGRFVTYTARERQTGKVIDLVFDLDNEVLVSGPALRKQDRSLADGYGTKLQPALRDTILAHPEALRIPVRIHFDVSFLAEGAGIPTADWAEQKLREHARIATERETKRLGMSVPLQAARDEPVQDAVLGVPDIVRALASPLILQIEMRGDVVVKDSKGKP